MLVSSAKVYLRIVASSRWWKVMLAMYAAIIELASSVARSRVHRGSGDTSITHIANGVARRD